MHDVMRPAAAPPYEQASQPRLELDEAANELLVIIAYLTNDDGPLRQQPKIVPVSPWHERMLLKASERLDMIDSYLRGRTAFLTAAKDHGYGSFEWETTLAAAALDTCRCATEVVDALLGGVEPTERQYEAMAYTALQVYPALRAEAGGQAHF